MSGHSKWSTIKRQKGAADIRRGQVFTKLSNAITLSVREGGGIADPNANFRLRLAIEAAKNANMPKENIERAINRASGSQANNMEEVVYEGFGPGGFGLIVEAITDNKNRTTPVIKNLIEKNGGSLGSPGTVSYQFEQKGLVIVEKNGKQLDEIFSIAVDSGAEDVEEAGEEVLIYTRPEQLAIVRDAVAIQGYRIKSAELIRKPIVIKGIEDRVLAEKALSFMQKIEELDDVQRVYANFDIPDTFIGIG